MLCTLALRSHERAFCQTMTSGATLYPDHGVPRDPTFVCFPPGPPPPPFFREADGGGRPEYDLIWTSQFMDGLLRRHRPCTSLLRSDSAAESLANRSSFVSAVRVLSGCGALRAPGTQHPP